MNITGVVASSAQSATSQPPSLELNPPMMACVTKRQHRQNKHPRAHKTQTQAQKQMRGQEEKYARRGETCVGSWFRGERGSPAQQKSKLNARILPQGSTSTGIGVGGVAVCVAYKYLI